MSALEIMLGDSPAQDLVWSQVAGLRLSEAEGRILMVWRAFVDESEKDGLLVLSGCFAPAESWIAFARDWEPLLKPFGILGHDGRYHFHMTEMAQEEER